MRNLPAQPNLAATPERGDAARICFRYRGGRRHRRLYDVFMTLDDPGGTCHIEIREALPVSADVPPFTSGRLNAMRLMRALDLIGLVKRITSRDHAPTEPGRLLYDAHMQIPWHPDAAAPAVNAPGSPVRARRRAVPAGTARRKSNRTIADALSRGISAQLQAHARIRYPLHGMGRTARLRRQVRTS